ncbi:hypothetical protein K7G98_11515 [Saccharothrix sp. MB29]|nr:hypothetical protein [Saccharothrix sp. MB29]
MATTDDPRAVPDRPFDLRQGPLFRAALTAESDDVHVLLLTSHHIVVDGWSLGVLAEELGALYRGEALAPLPLQYADYAVWQQDRAVDVEFWRAALAGVVPVELPTKNPTSPASARRRGHARVRRARRPASAVRDLAAATTRSLFTALTAASPAAAGPVRGRDDIAVGTVTAVAAGWRLGSSGSSSAPSCSAPPWTRRGRSPSSGPGRPDGAGRVRATTCRSTGWEAVGAPRDLSRTPLFDVMVVLQNAGRARPRYRLRVEEHPLTREHANFDLSIDFTRP